METYSCLFSPSHTVNTHITLHQQMMFAQLSRHSNAPLCLALYTVEFDNSFLTTERTGDKIFSNYLFLSSSTYPMVLN